MADYPSQVQLFRLIGRLGRGMGDTIDTGGDADLAPLVGARIICTPDLKVSDGGPVFKSTASSPPVTIFQETVLGTTNASGDIVSAMLDFDGKTFVPVDASQQGISLPFGGSPSIVPTGWTWTVTISVGGNFPDRVFSVYGSAGTSVDVTTMIPVPANPGTAVADWQATLTAAQTAAKQAGDALQATATGAALSGDNLVFTRRDGTTLNVGSVRGAKGDKGDTGDTTSTTNIAWSVTGTVPASGPLTMSVALDGSTSLSLADGVSGKSYTVTLVIKQSGSGGRVVTWPATIKWPAGVKPVLSSAGAAIDVIHLFWSGGGWYGFLGGQAFA